MFCPKCGQLQISEDVRFCCACGARVGTGAGSITRLIAMAMYIGLTALALAGWGPWSGPMHTQIRALIVLVSVITFLILFSRDLKVAFFKLFRQKEDRSAEEILSLSPISATLNHFGSAPHQSALPPVSSVPVNNPGQRGKNTAEMVRPPSVTEHTTDLLHQK